MAGSQVIRWDDSGSDGTGRDSSFEEENSPVRKKYKVENWVSFKTCDSLPEALTFMKSEKHFVRHAKYDTSNGQTIMYNCRKATNCAAKRRLLLCASDQKVEICKTDCDHDHIAVQRMTGMSEEQKTETARIIETGINKPKPIMHELRLRGMEPPPLKKLQNFLQHRRAKENPTCISLGQLEAWAQDNAKEPEDEDEPFVISHTFPKDEDKRRFGICVSTQRLLHFHKHSTHLQTDATYKLNWEGYPVLTGGVSDADKCFHPTFMALTEGESEEDFAFVFQAVQKAVGTDFCPSVLIADAAEAITNAFATTFGNNFRRVYCYFHMMKNLKENMGKLKDKSLWPTIQEDIRRLKVVSSVEEFVVVGALFVKKWTEKPKWTNLVEEFIQFIKNEHMDQRGNWYEGYAVGHPCTNNGVESYNDKIKAEGTYRQRLPMAQFLPFMLSQMWSLERKPSSNGSCKSQFALVPTISLQLETKAFHWMEGKPHCRLRTIAGMKTFFVSASKKPPLKEEDINKYLRMAEKKSWRTFDTYVTGVSRLYIVKVDDDNWKKSSCNCPSNLKENICKHVVGLAVKQKLHQLRPEARAIPLGQKRKRGRIPKAKKALLTD